MNLSNGVKLAAFFLQVRLRGRFPTFLVSITRLAAPGGFGYSPAHHRTLRRPQTIPGTGEITCPLR